MSETRSVVEVLADAKAGDEATAAALFPAVYAELRALASRYLERERRPGHTLQPTALVHEAYLKLAGSDRVWSGRDHFAAIAATAMRQVLVDHARRRGTRKRGGKPRAVSLDDVEIESEGLEEKGADGYRSIRVLQLDSLLAELALSDSRAAQAAEMRLFGGMNQDQIALVQGVSRKTVTLDWRFARAWLAGKVKRPPNDTKGAR